MLNRELQDQVFSKKYLFISNDKNVMKADYKYCMSCIYDLHIYMIIKILYFKKNIQSVKSRPFLHIEELQLVRPSALCTFGLFFVESWKK